MLIQRRIQEEIRGNAALLEQLSMAQNHIPIKERTLFYDYDTNTIMNDIITFNQKTHCGLDKENYQLRKNLFERRLDKSSFLGMSILVYLINDYLSYVNKDHEFIMSQLTDFFFSPFYLIALSKVEMRTDTNREVGKLINYFENFINDVNKDLINNTKPIYQSPIRPISQNTSRLSISLTDICRPVSSVLPIIIDDDDDDDDNDDDDEITPTMRDRTFSEDIYDRLTYQTILNTNSCSSPEQAPHSSIKSTKRRCYFNNYTNRKRLYRRRPPTYIKELKAYLAHRESSVNDSVKISDVKKFSNVLVWLSHQTTTPPSLMETSVPTCSIRTDHNTDQKNHLSSAATDSVIAITQENSHSYSGVIFFIYFSIYM